MDICAPLRRVEIPYEYVLRNKWMTKGLLQSSLNLCKLRGQMSGKPDDSEAVLKYKKYRNLYNRLIRVARNRYYGDLFDIHRGDISAT